MRGLKLVGGGGLDSIEDMVVHSKYGVGFLPYSIVHNGNATQRRAGQFSHSHGRPGRQTDRQTDRAIHHFGSVILERASRGEWSRCLEIAHAQRRT